MRYKTDTFQVMTGKIPFQDIKTNVAVTLNIFKGRLPSLDDHARMLLIRRLGSLMVNCWGVNPKDRPSATECMTTLRWMVSECLVDIGTHVAHKELSSSSRSALHADKDPIAASDPKPTF